MLNKRIKRHLPSLFMPACKHFISRHAWHWLRWALSTGHMPVPAWHLLTHRQNFKGKVHSKMSKIPYLRMWKKNLKFVRIYFKCKVTCYFLHVFSASFDLYPSSFSSLKFCPCWLRFRCHLTKKTYLLGVIKFKEHFVNLTLSICLYFPWCTS